MVMTTPLPSQITERQGLMKYELGKLADVRLGYQARGRIEPDPRGTHRIIQFKDIDTVEGLKLDDIYTIKPARDVANSLVRAGDVLFLSRGTRNIACHIDADLDNAIAAGNIYIIRAKTNKLLPAYLVWYINQPNVQHRLKEMASGVTIQTIPISVFAAMEIAVPPVAVQENIARLAALHLKEQVLTRELMEKREQLVQAVCQKAVSRELLQEGN